MSGDNNGLLSAYTGRLPYVFISYSHADSLRVESVLRLLQKNGIRYWYDDGIEGGKDWAEVIEERFKSSRMFLCFLANGVEQRPVVLEEIRMAIERFNSSEDYRVIFVFLEKMSANVFEGSENEKLRDFIANVQHFHYEGITEHFVRNLFAKDVFPDDVVKEEYMGKWLARAGRDISAQIEEAFSYNPYICRTRLPEWDENGGFYRVRMDEADPDAACLICLDNQWCPEEFYSDPLFQEKGIRQEHIASRQEALQRRELFRALLHNRQLIVNRAFLFNSRVFYGFYENDGPERDAFKALLADGSLLIFLTSENTPYDRAKRPAFCAKYYDLWGKICAETEEYCLRMDWNDEATNRLRLEQLLFGRFSQFCLTMRENNELLDDIESAFGFDEEHKNVFEALWNDAQLKIGERNRTVHTAYTRELFYGYFIVKEGTDASDCIIDPEKPLAPVLKEIVDFQYGLNLPQALGANAIYPPGGRLKEFYRSSERLKERTNEISLDVLTYAVNQFEPDFLSRKVLSVSGETLTLSEVCRLRSLGGWERYMRAEANAKKRAQHQEIDLTDIEVVWNRYFDWLEETAGKTGKEEHFERKAGALTVIYRLGCHEIITVYHGDTPRIDIKADFGLDKTLPAEKDHAVLLTVSYVCADILNHPAEDDPLLSELDLFEGITKESLLVVYNALLSIFLKSAHAIARTEENAAAFDAKNESVLLGKVDKAGDITLLYEVSKKRRLPQWKLYEELFKSRPDNFIRDDELKIETDITEICRLERKIKKSVANEGLYPSVPCAGVQYKSEYSVLVADMVTDKKGESFLYERIIPAAKGPGVVCIPIWNGMFVLLEQFRHALRKRQLCFPRGYGETGLSGEENAKKELSEELGANVLDIRFIGDISSDSGQSSGRTKVYLCRITKPEVKAGYEGIISVRFFTKEELYGLVERGKIDDGFTLSALTLMKPVI